MRSHGSTPGLARALRISAALALNAALLSPLVVERVCLGHTRDLPLRLVLFSFATSALWLALAQLVVRRAFVLHLCLLPLHAIAIAEVFSIVHYRTRLSSSVISVVLGSQGDAIGFLAAHRAPVLALGVPAVAIYIAALLGVRGFVVGRRPRGIAAVAAGLLAFYVPMYVACGDLAHLAALEESAPFGPLAQAWLAAEVHANAGRNRDRASGFTFGATRPAGGPATETYVLVIGESSRPDRWGLFGGPRDTTPGLARRSNVVLFHDVVAQASYTTASVPLMLTRATVRDPAPLSGERSVLSLAREVGFASYWLSTQRREPFADGINRCSSDASEQEFLDGQYDGALVDRVRRILDDGHARRLIVLHTMGSHFHYTLRVPRDFAGPARGPTGATYRERLHDAYDDTIAYTDDLLSRLIDALEHAGGVKALLYVADHGENLEDDARGLFGHCMSNEYDLPVPMLMWYSRDLAEAWPDKIAAAKRASTARLTTRAVFYTLVDLVGARLPDPALETESVLSLGHRESPRWVKGTTEVFDYDAWREGQHAAGARASSR